MASVRRFYERHYAPSNSALVLVGALGLSDGMALATRYFGAWRATSPLTKSETPRSPAIVAQPGRLNIFGLERDFSQSIVAIGLPCVGSANRDDTVFDLIATLFSGGLTSRLEIALREATGHTYGVQSNCVERSTSGEFIVDFDGAKARGLGGTAGAGRAAALD